jgi:hypothetical protein
VERAYARTTSAPDDPAAAGHPPVPDKGERS